MPGDRGERAIESGDGFVVAAEVQQRVAAIVERARMSRHQRQRGVEIGERLVGAAEFCKRDAAIEPGIAMARIARQHLIETGERVLRPVQREQCVAAVFDRVHIARAQGQRLVEAVERLGVALERVQHVGQIHPGVGRLRIDLERGRHQPVGLAHLVALRLRQPEQMQRVEVGRRRLQHARIKLLSLAQPALLMQGDGILHRLRQIETGRRRHGARYGPGSSVVQAGPAL